MTVLYDEPTHFERRELPGHTTVEGPVHGELDAHAVRAVEAVVRSDETEGHEVEKVRKDSATAIEVVWYDDYRDGENGPTKVDNYVISHFRDALQDFFGEHWQVDRKPDARRRNGENVQRVLVRRVTGLDFKYTDESDEDAKLIRHGTPEGVPDDARQWSDLDRFESSSYSVDTESNIYTYESSTGTIHLFKGEKQYDTGLWSSSVTEGTTTECGQPISPTQLATSDAISHYARVAAAHNAQTGLGEPLDPYNVLDEEALCGSCWRSYGDATTDDDGKVVNVSPPNYDWHNLAAWGEKLDAHE